MAYRYLLLASALLFAQSLAAEEILLPPSPDTLAATPLGDVHDMAEEESDLYDGMASDDIAANLAAPKDNSAAVAAIEAGDPKANLVTGVAKVALEPAKGAIVSAGTSAALGAAGSIGAGALAIAASPVVIIGGAAALACVELCPKE